MILQVDFIKPTFLNRLSGYKLYVVNVLGNANLLSNSKMHGFMSWALSDDHMIES